MSVLIACPKCSTSEAVAAAVYDDGFWPTLGVLASPILVVGLVAGLLHRIGRNPRTSKIRA